ncbi:MAG: DUF2997 domain-containing protein [Anaerolineales bacterium]|nr:DUF2997 domain-containing protein [Anaerolineales bacterium]
MSKKVEITFGSDGSVRVEAFGYKGASCEDATAFLDKLFGKPESKELKDSYNEQPEVVADGLPSGYCG